MVHYHSCYDSYNNEPLSCMGAQCSQPTHFLQSRLTRAQLSEVECTSTSSMCKKLFTTFQLCNNAYFLSYDKFSVCGLIFMTPASQL